MIHNVHERVVDAPATVVGELLDGVGRDGDRLWPSPAWEPMRLDLPVQVGADGGHGPIRYRVTEHDPGRRVRWTFHRRSGIIGFHELTVEPVDEGRCRVRHLLVGRFLGAMRWLGPLVVRHLHDAVVEDLLDNAEVAATGRISRPARWSPYVRLLRRFEVLRPVAVAIPDAARRLHASLEGPHDLADAWQVPRWPGMPTDPQLWAEGIFRDPPSWVAGLLLLRNALVGFVGIERGDRSAFATLDADSEEVVLGTDAGHLDFRASVLVTDDTVTVSTLASANNRRGHLYLAVVRRVHPAVVRAMLSRARRRFALPPSQLGEVRTNQPAAASPPRTGTA